MLSAAAYARELLAELGCRAGVTGDGDHPALGWRRAGLMAVTGPSEGPGRVCPAPLTVAADGALLALEALARDPGNLPLNGALLLGERARVMGLVRAGCTSAGGTCRLLDCADGRLAVSLARREDWALLPALLEEEAQTVLDWRGVAQALRRRSAGEIAARAAEMGLPVALDRSPVRSEHGWVRIERHGAGRPVRSTPRVVDLSALWAGPLAASLLAMMGAHVIKVECRHRPDGARGGHGPFYDLLNAGKDAVAFDFHTPEGRNRLHRLLESADIVIEGSRPRALRRLGIEAESFAAAGATWVSITAYGREGEAARRVGFGDDAGVGAGLATVMETAHGTPCFAGDAVADPLTGLHAALAAWAGWRTGGGSVIALSLAGTIAHVLARGCADLPESRRWQQMAAADEAPRYPLRTARRRAPALGTDTQRVLKALPC